MTARVGRDFVFPVKFDRKRPAIRDRAVPSVCHRTDRMTCAKISQESAFLNPRTRSPSSFSVFRALFTAGGQPANALQGLCCGSGVNLARSPRGPHITSGREAIRVAVRVDACVAFGVC